MIPAGTRLGPYEIVAPLGAGGMGQVYRARDARLHREVALKVLPSSASQDPERQQRFEQEARAAGALNHPNILAVHDVGVDGSAPYLVSELIDGESLRVQMERGIVPLKKLLDFAIQIAEGLTAAHAAGIVHRDLKPENVMVTRDGRVKIVDFGLAKALAVESPQAGRASPTQTAGLVVGTVPYMSPEQGRGGAVDFRSDQFSFGLILYEMATGILAFQRDTPVQTLSAIIGEEPRPIVELNPRVPAPLRWIIERCLSKDPADRYASTADLAKDLQTLRNRLPEATTGIGTTSEAVSPVRRWLWPAAISALVLSAALAAIGFRPATVDLSSYTLTPFATDPGYQGAPAWSPDGKTIAYVADVDGVSQIFTRSLAKPRRAQITFSRFECRDPFWSPDGTHIYFHSPAGATDALWSISATGGTPTRVLENAVQATISPDGRTLAFFRRVAQAPPDLTLWISSPPEAEPRPFSKPPFDSPKAGVADSVLHFSPDGSKLLVWWHRQSAGDPSAANREFFIVPMPDGTPYPVLQSLYGPQSPPQFSWLPDNRHVVIALTDERMAGTRLWLANTERDTARRLTIGTGSEGFPAVSPNGRTAAFTSEGTDFDLVLISTDGSVRPFFSTTRNEIDPAWSPTGKQYAFVTDRRGHQEIWLRNEDGWELPLVTDQEFSGTRTLVFGSLELSPDGGRLAYQRFGPEGYQIWISRIEGGPAVRLNLADSYQDAPTWSPDGNWIAYMTRTPGSWVLAKSAGAGGGAARTIVKDGILPFSHAKWSPDGRWILCETLEGLALVSVDGQEVRVLSEDPWLTYGWGIDGSRIYGLRYTDDLHHFLLASIDIRTAKEQIINPNLGPIPIANQPIRGFSRAGDKGFLVSIARVKSDIWLLEGFRPPRSFFDRLWFRRDS